MKPSELLVGDVFAADHGNTYKWEAVAVGEGACLAKCLSYPWDGTTPSDVKFVIFRDSDFGSQYWCKPPLFRLGRMVDKEEVTGRLWWKRWRTVRVFEAGASSCGAGQGG